MTTDDAEHMFKCMSSVYQDKMIFTEFFQAVCQESKVLSMQDKLKIHMMMDGELISQVEEAEKELKLEIKGELQKKDQTRVNQIIDISIVGIALILLVSVYKWLLDN